MKKPFKMREEYEDYFDLDYADNLDKFVEDFVNENKSFHQQNIKSLKRTILKVAVNKIVEEYGDLNGENKNTEENIIDIDEYSCKACGESWNYLKKDYTEDGVKHPQICPLCDMPISQMFKEVTKNQGIMQAIIHCFKRLLKCKNNFKL